MDFTLRIYTSLLQTFLKKGYKFITFEEYRTLMMNDELLIINEREDCSNQEIDERGDNTRNALPDKFIVLRHDVDLKVANSLATAKIENSLGIKASYYFRTLPESNNPVIIKEIAAMGHEIGYHYEDMSLCNADPEKAVEHFKKWLAYFNEILKQVQNDKSVKTICMHGAPTSKYDSKDIWQFADYRELGIIGEPYFDTNFSDLFYITDTGRMWDGYKVSVRDKIPQYQDEWIKKGLIYHSTEDIIKALENDTFPQRLMMTTHPQRWTDKIGENLWELCLQGLKNCVKRLLVQINSR